MPITAFSGGTSLEGHYRGVSLLLKSVSTAGAIALTPIQSSIGGICVDMSSMNKILEIHGPCAMYLSSPLLTHPIFVFNWTTEADSDLVCQPGIGWMEINETLRQKGKHAQ